MPDRDTASAGNGDGKEPATLSDPVHAHQNGLAGDAGRVPGRVPLHISSRPADGGGAGGANGRRERCVAKLQRMSGSRGRDFLSLDGPCARVIAGPRAAGAGIWADSAAAAADDDGWPELTTVSHSDE
nr:hypothetical protein CFP56_12181 [Quercus suber]